MCEKAALWPGLRADGSIFWRAGRNAMNLLPGSATPDDSVASLSRRYLRAGAAYVHNLLLAGAAYLHLLLPALCIDCKQWALTMHWKQWPLRIHRKHWPRLALLVLAFSLFLALFVTTGAGSSVYAHALAPLA